MVKRIHLPNEGDDGWSVDPQSIEQVIEARLRRQEIATRRLRESAALEVPKSSVKRGPLGLGEAEMTALWQEAGRLFFESATLPDELRDRRARFRETYEERIERLQKMPEMRRDAEYAREAELHAVLLARECEKAIARATGHFADMLTQAVIAKRGRKDFPLELRTEMWAKCLRFAVRLAEFEVAGQWVDKAWGSALRELPLPHVHRLDTMQEQEAEIAKFTQKFRPTFEQRIRHASSQWLDEADRRISLRHVLSAAPHRGARLNDPSKRAVALLLTVSPELTAEQVCGKLDAQNERRPGSAPIPKSWDKSGARSWTEVHEKFPGKVRTFVSKVRKDAGIASNIRGV